MNKFLLSVLLFTFSFQACSQQFTKEELHSRKRAQSIVDKYLKDKVQGKNYIVFSAGDAQFIVNIKNKHSLHEYYIDESNAPNHVIKRDTIVGNNDVLIHKMFDTTGYRKDYTSFRSKFYENGYETSSGNITYFSLVTSDGTRFGESRLSMFIKPTPMDAEIYLYFVKRMLANAGKK